MRIFGLCPQILYYNIVYVFLANKCFLTFCLSLSSAVWPQVSMQFCCLQPSPVHETAIILGNCFLFATRSRTLVFGFRRYGRRTPAATGIFIFLDANCIHVRLHAYSKVDAFVGHSVNTSS